MRSVSPISETPAKDSPSKRKRSISDPTIHPFAPHLREDNAGGGIYTEAQLAGARSPRSFVAERLGELKLQGTLSVIHFGGADSVNGDGAGRHKKVKFSSRRGSGASEELESIEEESLKPQPGNRRLKSPPPPGYREDRTEIQETPQAARASTDSPSPSHRTSLSPAPAVSRAAEDPSPVERPSSLSTAIPRLESQIYFDPSIYGSSKSSSPPPLKGRKSTETTDHTPEEDVLDPDDDGTGINGIGFKPTPAMAWQRTQKRKQQLQDWRTREAREARQRRSERRNKGAAIDAGFGDAGGRDAARRTVRFA